VAFDCYHPHESRGDGGGWVVSIRARELVFDEECAAALEAVRARLDEAKHPVAPGAERRLIRADETERELREAHELTKAIEVPSKFFVLYAGLALLLCKRGAAPDPPSEPKRSSRR